MENIYYEKYKKKIADYKCHNKGELFIDSPLLANFYNYNEISASVNEKLMYSTLKYLHEKGFLLQRLGTHLYARLINNIISNFNSYLDTESFLSDIIVNYSDPYSDKFREFARDDEEVGITSFHTLICAGYKGEGELFLPNEIVKDISELLPYYIKNGLDMSKSESSKTLAKIG